MQPDLTPHFFNRRTPTGAAEWRLADDQYVTFRQFPQRTTWELRAPLFTEKLAAAGIPEGIYAVSLRELVFAVSEVLGYSNRLRRTQGAYCLGDTGLIVYPTRDTPPQWQLAWKPDRAQQYGAVGEEIVERWKQLQPNRWSPTVLFPSRAAALQWVQTTCNDIDNCPAGQTTRWSQQFSKRLITV